MGSSSSSTMHKISISDEILNDPKYTRKTVQIRNDRILSYSEAGNLESDRIVLFHIGLMGSSLAVIMVHQYALQVNLRVITIDYPGIGDSTNVPNRSIAEWGHDVKEFCDKVLGTEQRIMLFGHCFGVPHTLAAWAQLMDRVSHVTLVAPWVGATSTNPWWMKYGVQKLPLQSYVPWAGANLLNSTTYFQYPLSYVVGAETSKLLRSLHEVQAYTRKQGSVGNKEMIRLALLASNKEEFWDPILQQITTNYARLGDKAIPVQVYHGTSDAMVSIEATQLLVEWLKGASCRVNFETVAKADHNTVLLDSKHMTTILETFAK